MISMQYKVEIYCLFFQIFSASFNDIMVLLNNSLPIRFLLADTKCLTSNLLSYDNEPKSSLAALPAPKNKNSFFTLSFDIDDKNLKTILEIINKVKDVAVIENACSSTGKIDKSSDWESVVKTIATKKLMKKQIMGIYSLVKSF